MLDGRSYAELGHEPSSCVRPMTYSNISTRTFEAILTGRAPPTPQLPHNPQTAGSSGMSFFGKLTSNVIPFHEPIALMTSMDGNRCDCSGDDLDKPSTNASLYLWHEYVTSTDHKRICIM